MSRMSQLLERLWERHHRSDRDARRRGLNDAREALREAENKTGDVARLTRTLGRTNDALAPRMAQALQAGIRKTGDPQWKK